MRADSQTKHSRSKPSADLRLVPITVLVWFGAWFAVGRQEWNYLISLIAAVLALLIASLAVWRKKWLIAGSLVAVIAVIVIALAQHAQFDNAIVMNLAHEQALVIARGRMSAQAQTFQNSKTHSSYTKAKIDLVSLQGRAVRVVANIPIQVLANTQLSRSISALAPGSLVEFTGVAEISNLDQPIVITIRLRAPPKLLAAPGLIDRGVNRIRRGLVLAMSGAGPQQAALVPSLVVGDTSMVDQEMRNQFQASSLTHLMAVSGANLTLVVGFLLFLAKGIGIRGWWIRAVAGLGIVLFVMICRGEPSVLRAAAMGGVALAGLGAGRDNSLRPRYLCTAVIVLLLWDPWLARSWGFALSVVATAGIIWLGSRWQEKMSRWCWSWIAEAICVPLAAQFATQPLVSALSGQLSLIGIFANVLVGPFVGPATVLGLIAAVLSPVSGYLAGLVGSLAGWAVTPILWVAEQAAKLPTSSVAVSIGIWTLPMITVSCLLGVITVDWLVTRRVAMIVALGCLFLVTLFRPQPLGWPGPWKVVSCEVGQGDATVLQAGHGQALLVDVGPADGKIGSCLRSLGVQAVPLLVLTHYHSDHIGGLKEVLAEFPVGLILVSNLSSPIQNSQIVTKLANAAKVKIQTALPGQKIRIGDVAWQTVSAPTKGASLFESAKSQSTVENDASVVGIATIGQLRVLLPGDAELSGQREVLHVANISDLPLQVDILKMPHHGSTRQDPAFFAASRARIAIASVGSGNLYGHPSPYALQLASSYGMEILRTDIRGSIAMWDGPNGITVITTKR